MSIGRSLKVLWLLPRNVLVLLLRGYRAGISPLYGQVCRYYPSCSGYALEAVQQRGVIVGVALSGWRILRCNPWSRGGVDEVRPRPGGAIPTTDFGFALPDHPHPHQERTPLHHA